MLLLGSANRDERQFAAADQFDLRRRPNPHVSFGGGIHNCFGSALARLEARLVLDGLRRRCVRLEPAGPVVRREEFRSYVHVPLVGFAD